MRKHKQKTNSVFPKIVQNDMKFIVKA